MTLMSALFEEIPQPDIHLVPLGDLRGSLSPRLELDPGHVDRLAAVIDALPPIVVHAETMQVLDGAHRVAAHRAAGLKAIPARFFSGSPAEALLESARWHTQLALPLTAAERKRLAQQVLEVAPGWSDRRVAELCGLSPKTVATVRTTPNPRRRAAR